MQCNSYFPVFPLQQHHDRQVQRVISVRLLLLHISDKISISVGLCLSRHCSRTRYELGLTNSHRVIKTSYKGNGNAHFLRIGLLCYKISQVFFQDIALVVKLIFANMFELSSKTIVFQILKRCFFLFGRRPNQNQVNDILC